MNRIRRFLSNLRALVTRETTERDLNAEISSHLGEDTDAHMRQGFSREDAQRAALRRFGSVTLVKEMHRETRSFTWLDDAVRDIRYGLRGLTRNLGFTAVAVLTLGLGAGATTAMFTVADALLFRPPPFEHSDRLYWIYDVNPRLRVSVNDATSPSPANFVDWRAQSRSFDRMVAWRNWFFSVAGPGGGGGAAEQVRGVNVSPLFFDMLSVRAALGRTFRAEEEEQGRDQVVVLTYGFWQRHFGGDPGIVGKTVSVDGRPFSVIGVLPSDFYFLWPDSAIFMPMTVDNDFRGRRAAHSIVVLARLAPDATKAGAQSEMDRITQDLERAYPTTNNGWRAALLPVFPLNKNLRDSVLILLAAVGCVLLIACINVASLLIVRAGARQRELSMRAALGASRGRLVRQLIAESGLLAALGAVCGVIFAVLALRALQPLIPQVQVARPLSMTVNVRVLIFALCMTVMTTLGLGLLPALLSSRTDRLRVSEGSQRRPAAGRTLLIVEIALSLVLLVGAMLLVRSLWNLQNVDPGFRAERVMTMQLSLPQAKYSSAASVSEFYQQLLQRLQQFPEVKATAVVNTRPFLGWSLGARLQIPGQPSPGGTDPVVGCRIVSPGYLATLGVPLLRGRGLTEGDGPNGNAVALINATMARRFWPNEDPINKVIRVRLPASLAATPWWPEQMTDTYTIVGEVGNIKENRLSDQTGPVVYLSYLQSPSRYAHLLVRSETSATSVSNLVQRQIRTVDPDMGVYDARSMETVLDQAVAAPRLNTVLLWIFAMTALLLSAIGVYGVTSYAVAQRSREFAIRMAIGASTQSVFQLVAREGVGLAAIGTAIGTVGALIAMRTIGSLLYGVGPTDISTFVASAGVVLVASALACSRPAWRATRVDPLKVLRAE